MTAGAICVPTIVPLRAPQAGKLKTCIDSSTKIEITSETPGVSIYYTVNNAKPNPFNSVGPDAKATVAYKEPFRLAGGKRTIKALAVSADGLRESHCVTKTFEVEQINDPAANESVDGLGFIQDLPSQADNARRAVKKFAHTMVTSKEAWAEIEKQRAKESMTQEMSNLGIDNKKLANAPRFLNNRRNNSPNGKSPQLKSSSPPSARRFQPPDTSTQMLRLQRETDFLSCVYCFAPRPSDPYIRFCTECGNSVPPLPDKKLPPPEPGQLVTCVHCKSMVPFNTPICVVCETPMPQQNQPMASIKLAEKLICPDCGTANPSNLPICVTCEAPLTGHPVPVTNKLPPAPRQDGRLITCSKCSRVNNPDARYCDWCGSKPSTVNMTITCVKCKAHNQPYALYCGSCGATVEPPTREDTRSSGMTVNSSFSQNALKNSPAQWLPIAMPIPVEKFEIATQTVGLFFPSQREITKKQKEQEEQLAQAKQARDRNPLMTSVSPGKGYWRKQMDHICAHLKTHAQNSPEFRALIGEPRMGKIISATVHEDGYELSLSCNFALRGNKDPFTGQPLGSSTREYLSNYTERALSVTSDESLASSRPTSARSNKKRVLGSKRVKRSPKKRDISKEEKLSAEDKMLLKEIGKNGEGDPDEIQRLIDEGANPNVVNKNNIPALHLAVGNKHVDAIPMLIKEGAEVNKKGPNRGNTALHEAVGFGHAGLSVIDSLLGNGADPHRKNDKGESAYDFAIKNGHESVSNRFNTYLGQSALSKLSRPKPASIIDMF